MGQITFNEWLKVIWWNAVDRSRELNAPARMLRVTVAGISSARGLWPVGMSGPNLNPANDNVLYHSLL
jgi:hypothetical protein